MPTALRISLTKSLLPVLLSVADVLMTSVPRLRWKIVRRQDIFSGCLPGMFPDDSFALVLQFIELERLINDSPVQSGKN